MSGGTIDMKREGLGHAISDNSLTVPVYQRSYMWEDEHVRLLFEDIANAIAENSGEYFLGTIVVTTGGGTPEVVDGQQRLATTTILIAAIRDYFTSVQDIDAAFEIERQYLLSRNLRTREILPKLRLNEFDNDFFVKRILSRSGTEDRKVAATKDSHRNIEQAAKAAERHVRNLLSVFKEDDRASRLHDWIDFIRDRARVIWVTVPDDQDAFLIFETLNDRGLDLSIADLLKNYLFRHSGDRIREAQARWANMAGALETLNKSDVVVTYIRHLWGSMYGAARERALYGSIKSKIKTKQAAIDLANALGDEALNYASLLSPDSPLWQQHGTTTKNCISVLLTLQAEQIRPLLLAIVKHMPPAEVKKAIRLSISWSVRLLITGGGGGGTMERNYADRALQVRSGELSTAQELAVSMAQVVPKESEFEAAFAVARVSQTHLARYYLRALESCVKGADELLSNVVDGVRVRRRP